MPQGGHDRRGGARSHLGEAAGAVAHHGVDDLDRPRRGVRMREGQGNPQDLARVTGDGDVHELPGLQLKRQVGRGEDDPHEALGHGLVGDDRELVELRAGTLTQRSTVDPLDRGHHAVRERVAAGNEDVARGAGERLAQHAEFLERLWSQSSVTVTWARGR